MNQSNKWSLFRLIIPAFPEVNVYSKAAKKTTALGPVMVASAADKVEGIRAEVIDENNLKRKYKKYLDSHGNFDHSKLQKERPATVVGFYCGLSSTMERVWQLADFYNQQKVNGKKVVTIAGSWHVHYMPVESIRRGIDIVIHGDGEHAIQQILERLKEGKSINTLPGISFRDSQGDVLTNPPKRLAVEDLDALPYPNFGLLRLARKLKTYPISRVRGCSHGCEFCSVKGKPRFSSGRHLFEQVKWLVETQNAKNFFIVDDRPADDREGFMDFLALVKKQYGRKLKITMQFGLEDADDTPLLVAMKEAGVRIICIGYESPLDEELLAMKKGYTSQDMLTWTKILRSYGFWIHAMFIWGYPLKGLELGLSPQYRLKGYKTFIRKAKLSTIQILRAIPLVGTRLRTRLGDEGKLFPLDVVPWSKYDGNYVCFKPTDMSIEQLQHLPLKLMKGFYRFASGIGVGLRTVAMPFDYLIRDWEQWHTGWDKDVKNIGARLLILGWEGRFKKDNYIEKLEKHQSL